MDAGEAPWTRAAQQAEQKRLGLIVTRMASGNDIGLELGRDPLEELIPGLPAGILEGSPQPPGARSHVDQIRAKRQPELHRERAAELLVTMGRVAQPVIEVRDARDRELPASLEIAQQPQQRNRIRPARQRDEHTIAAAHQRVAANRVEDALRQCHRERPILLLRRAVVT